jgi:hypothetical protein
MSSSVSPLMQIRARACQTFPAGTFAIDCQNAQRSSSSTRWRSREQKRKKRKWSRIFEDVVIIYMMIESHQQCGTTMRAVREGQQQQEGDEGATAQRRETEGGGGRVQKSAMQEGKRSVQHRDAITYLLLLLCLSRLCLLLEQLHLLRAPHQTAGK